MPESRSAPRRTRYHHGRLREAMVEAATLLAHEVGPHQVTVSEAARRAGVSSGAPFRHFPDRTALMTAVAEEAMRRFKVEVDTALAAARDDPPLEQLRALGVAFLHWATRSPSHFKVISDRALIDFEGSEVLVGLNAEIQGQMEAILLAARAAGQIQDGPLADLQLGARAMVYGLARMAVDGQLPQWGVGAEEVEMRLTTALDQYVEGLARV